MAETVQVASRAEVVWYEEIAALEAEFRSFGIALKPYAPRHTAEGFTQQARSYKPKHHTRWWRQLFKAR